MIDNVNPSLPRCDYSLSSPAQKGGWGGDREKGGRGYPKKLGGGILIGILTIPAPYPSLLKHTTGSTLCTVMEP